MSVNKDNVRLWVDALRSGNYVQTPGVLHRLHSTRDTHLVGYCCLGVACSVAIDNGVPIAEDISDGAIGTFYWVDDGVRYTKETELPVPVMEWLGLKSENPVVDVLDAEDYADAQVTAIHMNDAEGSTFAEIADALERTYLKDDEEASA